MSALANIKDVVFPEAFALLPDGMDSPEARAMLIAIGLQESRFEYRHQIGGPAKGFWQFERGGGVRGVLNHASTQDTIRAVCERRSVIAGTEQCYDAMETDDVLACCFARLLLWTHPFALPMRDEVQRAWDYYLFLWRPGKPHRESWDAFYQQAWT